MLQKRDGHRNCLSKQIIIQLHPKRFLWSGFDMSIEFFYLEQKFYSVPGIFEDVTSPS